MSKNENEYLKENIEYHSALGVDHFYIYDNKSNVSLKKTLNNFPNVTVIEWDDENIGSHCRAFDNCLKNYGASSRWIGFIDTDEFLVLKKDICIKQFMKSYESYAALGVNWKCFGSSGHLRKQQSVTKSFIHSVDVNDNTHIKSIVQPKWTIRTNNNPHAFKYKGDKVCVNEKFKIITGPWNKPATHDLIQLNHYVTRSRQDFENKRKRGGGNIRSSKKLTEEFWDRFQNGIIDTSLLELKKKLSLK